MSTWVMDQERRGQIKTDRGLIIAIEELLRNDRIDWDTAVDVCVLILGRYLAKAGGGVEPSPNDSPLLRFVLYREVSPVVSALLARRN